MKRTTRANPALVIVVVACATALGGCTAISDFGRFMFGGGADGGVDSGMIGGDGGPSDGGGVPDGGDGGPQDGGGVDGGQDGGPRAPTSVVQTSGGAVITTPEYRLRVSVGAPEPVGAASDSSHRVRVGPQAR